MIDTVVPVSIGAPGSERAIGGGELSTTAFGGKTCCQLHFPAQLHQTRNKELLLTAVCVLAADATSDAGSLAMAVLAVDDALTGREISTTLNFEWNVVTGHQLRGGAGSCHGESKEQDDRGENVGGLHVGGGWLLEVIQESNR